MKIRFCAALLLAALSITLLPGCAAPVEQSIEAMEEKIDDRLDAAEKVIVDALVPAAPSPATEPAPTTAPAPTRPVSADTPLLTREEAIAIALTDAGFTEDQVTRLRTEFDYDDGRPEYEVDFRYGGFEYDYEIHAETGAILSKDKDRED